MDAYTPYEKSSLSELEDAFASPFRTPISALVHVMSTERGTPAVRRRARSLAAAVEHALLYASQISARTVTAGAVCEAFRREGYRKVYALGDVQGLELWEADEVTAKLRPKYLIAGALLGLLTGGMGAKGAILDLPVVTVLALRAINEYALYYGFDPKTSRERAFAVSILTAALSPSSNMRTASLHELVERFAVLARAWDKNRPLRLAVPIAFTLVRRLVRGTLTRRNQRSLSKIGLRLTRLVGAATNVWLLLGVTRAAQSAYRERRLR